VTPAEAGNRQASVSGVSLVYVGSVHGAPVFFSTRVVRLDTGQQCMSVSHLSRTRGVPVSFPSLRFKKKEKLPVSCSSSSLFFKKNKF
jgi:hypothetical protein